MTSSGGAAPGRGVELLAGPHAVCEALRAGRRTVYRLLLSRQERSPLVAEILTAAEARRLRVETLLRAELDRLVRGGSHQGIVAEVGPYPYAEPAAVLTRVLTGRPPGWMLVLDEIQDPQNLGAVVRTAEAAGAAGLLMPHDRAAAITPAAVRASAGAAEHLAIGRVGNLAAFLTEAKRRGVWVAGAAAEGERQLFAADLTGPLALVIGGEGRGLRPLTRRRCDFLVRIPMLGRVGSLNASAAAAVCIYEIVRQRLAAGQTDRSG
ncbi:MAG: 23S rRNA (guanosine(2251)-2'-O)-methyltransferase RlmB [candidate division NC10 bacterium]|nr:23S rRNA (guanosine(2251)-2'-O)-methyltransferase RlmB [candidate division NC10 bacterium]